MINFSLISSPFIPKGLIFVEGSGMELIIADVEKGLLSLNMALNSFADHVPTVSRQSGLGDTLSRVISEYSPSILAMLLLILTSEFIFAKNRYRQPGRFRGLKPFQYMISAFGMVAVRSLLDPFFASILKLAGLERMLHTNGSFFTAHKFRGYDMLGPFILFTSYFSSWEKEHYLLASLFLVMVELMPWVLRVILFLSPTAMRFVYMAIVDFNVPLEAFTFIAYIGTGILNFLELILEKFISVLGIDRDSFISFLVGVYMISDNPEIMTKYPAFIRLIGLGMSAIISYLLLTDYTGIPSVYAGIVPNISPSKLGFLQRTIVPLFNSFHGIADVEDEHLEDVDADSCLDNDAKAEPLTFHRQSIEKAENSSSSWSNSASIGTMLVFSLFIM